MGVAAYDVINVLTALATEDCDMQTDWQHDRNHCCTAISATNHLGDSQMGEAFRSNARHELSQPVIPVVCQD